MAMANVKGKGRLSEILGTGANRRVTHYRSNARMSHAEVKARRTLHVPDEAEGRKTRHEMLKGKKCAEMNAAVMAGVKYRDNVLVDKRKRATQRKGNHDVLHSEYYDMVLDKENPYRQKQAVAHHERVLLHKVLVNWHETAVNEQIDRHERELNALLKHHQIHLYAQKDKAFLMVQSQSLIHI